MKPITITLTPGEAEALAGLMDRESRMNGAQAAATFGNVLRQMIEAAKAETPSEQEADNG